MRKTPMMQLKEKILEAIMLNKVSFIEPPYIIDNYDSGLEAVVNDIDCNMLDIEDEYIETIFNAGVEKGKSLKN